LDIVPTTCSNRHVSPGRGLEDYPNNRPENLQPKTQGPMAMKTATQKGSCLSTITQNPTAAPSVPIAHLAVANGWPDWIVQHPRALAVRVIGEEALHPTACCECLAFEMHQSSMAIKGLLKTLLEKTSLKSNDQEERRRHCNSPRVQQPLRLDNMGQWVLQRYTCVGPRFRFQ
jgi:hypothetical protein